MTYLPTPPEEQEFQKQIIAYLEWKLADPWVLWNQAGRSLTWGEDVLYTPLGEYPSQSNSDVIPLGEYLWLRESEFIRIAVSQAIKEMNKKGESCETPQGNT